MKNVAVSRDRQPQTVAQQEVLDAMNPRKRYTQDEVCALLPHRPKMAVRDTLATLVNKGIVWRDASGSRVRYSLPDAKQLIARKTTIGPSNFGTTLTGYDASHRQFRELCEATRR